jgi:putative MATE family efflux protein
MMLEMAMESVFALVDLYFVGHLPHSSYAIQTVGLTESCLTIIYSLAVGMSMAATAIVARRIGEKDPVEAAKAGMQTVTLAILVNFVIGVAGFYYASNILSLMGASSETVRLGTSYTRIMMAESLIIVMLFLINGIFRGAGNAAIAMRSLWIANIANIFLCPLFINVLDFGLTGAAIATTIGRGTGVVYQLYHLFNGKNLIKVHLAYLRPHWEQIKAILKIAIPGILQFVIGSCSWIFLAELVATTGGDHGSAGYQTSIRLMLFFMLPAWGMSNAAATLVGQNLGAKELARAEDSVYKTVKYNVLYMAGVTVITYLLATYLTGFFTNDEQVRQVATQSLQILSVGYIFYGIGMVMMSAFNGAGDTWTTTWVNLFGFWLLQVPLAYLLDKYFKMGITGVFLAIPIAETSMALASFFLFRGGKWKKVKV